MSLLFDFLLHGSDFGGDFSDLRFKMGIGIFGGLGLIRLLELLLEFLDQGAELIGLDEVGVVLFLGLSNFFLSSVVIDQQGLVLFFFPGSLSQVRVFHWGFAFHLRHRDVFRVLNIYQYLQSRVKFDQKTL